MDLTSAAASAASKLVDPAAAESAKVAGDLFTRLLGPLADEVGAGLASKYRLANVQRVAKRAAQKAKLEEEGSIPARVAAAVFDAAQWSEQEFVVEYLSGVLASARSASGVDDSAVAWSALISRLPTAAIKLHYFVYRAFRDLVAGVEINSLNQLLDSDFFVTITSVSAFLGDDEEGSVVEDQLHLLAAEGLLAIQAWGPAEFLTRRYRRGFSEPALVLRATPRGMALLLQAFGYSGLDPVRIARKDLQLDIVSEREVSDPRGAAVWTRELPERNVGLTVF